VTRRAQTGTAAAPGLAAGQMEFRALSPELEGALAAHFDQIRETGEDRTFHPHPFTAAEARARCAYRGRDVYCVAVAGGAVLGYGMLRGWDEGFAVPSLGIMVAREARGTGLARALMLHLHGEARRRGARRVRLKVYPDNAPAVGLYRSLGYVFEAELDQGQLVGHVSLDEPPPGSHDRPRR